MVVGVSRMKTNILSLVLGKTSSIALLGLVIFIGSTANVRSQNLVASEINGLFTPTQSQEFFREGRRNFRLQEWMFDRPDIYFKPNLLKIDPQLLDRLEQTKSWFDRDKSNPESTFEFTSIFER
jgi:hypothetical protein